ncbi:hypothetical protein AB6E20_20795 [Vibrio cyclitrophicus]
MEQTEQLDQIEIEELEQHDESEELALLAELGEEDFDPSQSEQKTDAKHAALLAGEATASAVLGVTEQMLKQFGHQEFAFDAEQAQNVASAAAPLFVKYGGELPPWLAHYKEELSFVIAAGALGFTSFNQIRTLKAIDEAKEVNPQETESEGKEEVQ